MEYCHAPSIRTSSMVYGEYLAGGSTAIAFMKRVY